MASFVGSSAIVGGIPTTTIDIPVTSVFMALYIAAAACNMIIYTTNKKQNHRFFMSMMLYGFCMARIVTCVMRIVWACRTTNTSIAIAAQIFNNAGILIIYIINLVFSQRMLRAKQPYIGWHGVLGVAFKLIYACVVAFLIMGIATVVIQINSTDAYTLNACRDVQLTANTFFLVVACLPVLIATAAYILPSSEIEEAFGHRSVGQKTILLIISSCLCLLVAGFKCGTIWQPAPPATAPRWYDSKAAFYCFGFMTEIIILVLMLVARVDKVFHIPDKSKKPGDYSRREKSQSTDDSAQHGQEKIAA